MIHLTLESLQKALQNHQQDAKIQTETQQVYTVLNIDQREFPLFLRIFEEGLVQMIAFLPSQIQDETKAGVARLLHLFNKELDIPGFGMDEIAGVIFFRCIIPATDGGIDEKLFNNFFNTVETACKTFSPTIEAIAAGAADFDEILKKAIEANQKKA